MDKRFSGHSLRRQLFSGELSAEYEPEVMERRGISLQTVPNSARKLESRKQKKILMDLVVLDVR